MTGYAMLDKIAEYHRLIDSRLRELIPDRPPYERHYRMMAYHFGWRDEQGNPVDCDSGKRIRPVLCLLACEEVGGRPEAALPGALAVELVHNFSLLHDDVEDGDVLRRNRATVWSLWGTAHGINVGDGLFALALRALAGADGALVGPGLQALARTCTALCEGQYLDLSQSDAPRGGMERYLRMVADKTSALFGCAMELGALFGGAGAGDIARLRALGEALGEAYQMRDDIHGVWGNTPMIGKTPSDVHNRKLGLPAAVAFERAEGADLLRLTALYSGPPPLDGDVRWVLDLFARLGVRERSFELFAGRLRRAERFLASTGSWSLLRAYVRAALAPPE